MKLIKKADLTSPSFHVESLVFVRLDQSTFIFVQSVGSASAHRHERIKLSGQMDLAFMLGIA